MIEILGLLYDLAKDLKDYLKWNEEVKLVEFGWPEKSGLRAKSEAEGLTISWSRPEKVASRQLDGYEIVYEVDKLKRVRRKLVLSDGSVLIGKRNRA